MSTDALSDLDHKARIVEFSMFVTAVWRTSVARWGLGASLLLRVPPCRC